MKGVSALVVVILLLLITIGIVGFVFLFLQRTIASGASAAENQTQKELSMLGQSFVVENAFQNVVTVRNTGTREISDITFYVNDVKVDYTGPLPIPVNGAKSFTLDLSEIYDPEKLKVIACPYTEENKIFNDQEEHVPESAGRGTVQRS